MSGPAELLRQIPPEFTLLASIIIGSIILVSLVLFHGMGVHWVSTIHKLGDLRLRAGRPHVLAAFLLFGTAIFLLLSLHIIGVIWWAIVLRHLGLIHTANNAIYFCANAYTTLGYGEVDLDPSTASSAPSSEFPDCSRSHGQPACSSISFRLITRFSKLSNSNAPRRRSSAEI